MTDFAGENAEHGSYVAVGVPDHRYEVRTLIKSKAVLSTHTYEWSEYAGDEYLEDGDEVHTIWIVT